MNTKPPRTKVGASREEREAKYYLESVSNSRKSFQTLAKSNKWLAKGAGVSIAGHNRSTSHLVDIFIRHFKCVEVSSVERL